MIFTPEPEPLLRCFFTDKEKKKEEEKNMQIELTSEQIKILKNKSKGSCLVKGVAGSGKTTVMIEKIADLLAFRNPIYEVAADYVLLEDNKSLDEINKIMQEHNKKQDELTKEYGW